MKRSIQGIFITLLLALALPSWAALPAMDGSGRPVPSLAPLLKEINPAVVNISTQTTRTVQNPLMNDPFFRRFFNVPQHAPRQHKTQSAGSGVIIDADKGIVVSNHHVIDGADEVTVALEDGRSFKAEVLGSDPEVDIAVLQIDADDLSELRIANSDQLLVGDFVIAIGNPFGLGQTVTTGVVSALGRSGLGIEGYENFIQTDASINPGNSGGALVNLRGELVGINTAILAPSGGNVGIGFAIPTNMAKASIDQILEYGEVKRGRLGVVIQDLSSELAEAFDLENQRGVVIAEVQPKSAADKAGLQAGDVVIELDGKAIESSAELRNAIGVRRIGEKIELVVLRDGKRRIIKARIGEAVEEASQASLHPALTGAKLATSDERAGVLVVAIEAGSAAAKSGLRPGDVILSANRRNVKDLDDLRTILTKSGDSLLLRIQRGPAALYLVIR